MNSTSNKRMRITMLFLGSTGAGPVYALEMAKAIAAIGCFEMQIVVSRRVYNLTEWEQDFSHIENIQLDFVETYRHTRTSFVFSLFQFWKTGKIIRLIRQYKPDCLYIPFPSPWDFLLYPRLCDNTRIITTLHDPHPHDAIINPFERFLHSINRKALLCVDTIIILNSRDVDYVEKEYKKKVAVIPHASFSYYVKDIKETSTLRNTIGFLGRIEPYKGLDLLVEAFNSIDNNQLHLIIAGNGTIDSTTLSKINENQRIELINRYIKDEEFSGLLNRMDFVVLPYKRASQSGVIPLVFSHGKTVVVTNVGALSDQVPDGTGVVVEATSKSLKDTIVGLYAQSDRIQKMGQQALDYANKELTWARSAELLVKVIENESN